MQITALSLLAQRFSRQAAPATIAPKPLQTIAIDSFNHITPRFGSGNGTELSLRDNEVSDSALMNLPTSAPQLEKLQITSKQLTPASLKHLESLPNLKQLILHATNLTDADLENLKGLTNLTVLKLTGIQQFTGAGLMHLKGLTRLGHLDLSHSPITDDGLQQLNALPQLKELRLYNTNVTDTGLNHLRAFPNLKIIEATWTLTTQQGAWNLQAALPGTQVYYSTRP